VYASSKPIWEQFSALPTGCNVDRPLGCRRRVPDKVAFEILVLNKDGVKGGVRKKARTSRAIRKTSTPDRERHQEPQKLAKHRILHARGAPGTLFTKR
jgi:hypothetical protein